MKHRLFLLTGTQMNIPPSLKSLTMEEQNSLDLGIGSLSPGTVVMEISLETCLLTALAFVEVWEVKVPQVPDMVR